MGRIHLFEFEDQHWFPAALRDYGTDFLQFLANKTAMYRPVVPMIGEALEKSKTNTIIDLGSGSGGGLIWLNEVLRSKYKELKIILTDYFPNIQAFRHTAEQADNIGYFTNPVDARNVPDELKGLRTQFLSLHHFKPLDAKRILQNAVDTNTSIAIFEGQERSLPSILAMLLSPISVLIATPFIRPFRLGRIVFTYLIPIVPLFVLWDGIVSSFRTYSVKEMKQLVSALNGAENYDWNIGKVRSGPANILYLIGTAKS